MYSPSDDAFHAAYDANEEWLSEIILLEYERDVTELARLEAGAHRLLAAINRLRAAVTHE